MAESRLKNHSKGEAEKRTLRMIAVSIRKKAKENKKRMEKGDGHGAEHE